MGIVRNYRTDGAFLCRSAWALLLVVATFTSPSQQALGADPLRSAEQAAAGIRDHGSPKPTDAWGPERDGLRTRLLPAQKDYVVGQPARFRLELKNVGTQKRVYDSQQVDVNGSLAVTDPDGKAVPYVGGSFQTFGHFKSIAPGETVVLFDGPHWDFTDQYLFVKPGKYTVQFRGESMAFRADTLIPPSNKTTVQLRPGTVPVSMQVPAQLVAILPEQWHVSLNGRVYEVEDGKIAPPGWERGPGTYVSLVRDAQYKNEVLCVEIWVARRKLVWTGKGRTGGTLKHGKAAAYLGEGPDGHVFWTVPEKAEEEWPEIRVKVRGALGISPTKPGPTTSN